MDCKLADESLVDLLYEELSPDRRQALEAHLEGCARCAGELARLRGVLRVVRDVPLDEPAPQVSERILRLARAARDSGERGAAARAASEAGAAAPLGRLWRWSWSPALVAVMLGLVVVAVGLVAFQKLQQPSPELVQDAREVWAPPPAPAPAAPRSEARKEAVADEAPAAPAVPGGTGTARPEPGVGLDHFSFGDQDAAGRAVAARGVAGPEQLRPEERAPERPAAEPAYRPGPAKAPAGEKVRAKAEAQGWDSDGSGVAREERAEGRPEPGTAGVLGGVWKEDAVDPRYAQPPPPADKPAEAAKPADGPRPAVARPAPKPSPDSAADRDLAENAQHARRAGRELRGAESGTLAGEGAEAEAKTSKKAEARPVVPAPAPEPARVAESRPAAAAPAPEGELGSGGADEVTAQVGSDEELAATRSKDGAADDAGRKGGGGQARRDDGLLARGERLLAAGDPAGAADALGAFLRAAPGDPRAPAVRFRHARALFLAGRCAEAVTATRQALAARPAHPSAGEALLDQASCEVRLGRFQDAARTYQRVEREHPELAGEARRGLERLPQ
ncbi:MAG TPA: tetratricopeptide repeat protein [Myxococcota bacterium]|nr:tetratricopeptide repeat protein [Myxococcota bacterium]HRY93546.1 tetratricopeptide repeat protein [Myxococcota bacterium]HSA22508.1 tetratricopeptide repeat protein [Myxococcota bacterium]